MWAECFIFMRVYLLMTVVSFSILSSSKRVKRSRLEEEATTNCTAVVKEQIQRNMQ